MSTGPGNVVKFEQALRLVEDVASTVSRPRTETVSLLEAAGRILAAAVRADRDHPAFDRSTRDGFAVRAADLARARALPVIGEVRAGERWQGSLPDGAAIQIMTGAPVPAGADAVVMIEHVTRADAGIQILEGRQMKPGENIVPRGAEARAGESILSAGTLIGPSGIGLAAFCGCTELTVFARPSVAIVSTGDELVEVRETPGPEQIRNSNSSMIDAMVAAAGGSPDRLPIARDVLSAVRERIVQGRSADLLVFSGGVSMGDYDLVEEVLAEFGAEFFFTGVRMQPGKPVVFGRLPACGGLPPCLFFGLPGNPVSAEVTFHCFAGPLLRALAGTAWSGPYWAQATLAESTQGRPGLTRLLPARLTGIDVRLVPWQGSGDLAANARANCYAELLSGRDYQPGDVIRILLR